jgi:hypothetical protein
MLVLDMIKMVVIDYCNKLGIVCTINRRNKGRLEITAQQLRQYIARQQRNAATTDTDTTQ